LSKTHPSSIHWIIKSPNILCCTISPGRLCCSSIVISWVWIWCIYWTCCCLENIYKIPFTHKFVSVEIWITSGSAICLNFNWKICSVSLRIIKDKSTVHFSIVCKISHDNFSWNSLFCVVSIQNNTFRISTCTIAIISTWISCSVLKS
jgi:hypothetical protein